MDQPKRIISRIFTTNSIELKEELEEKLEKNFSTLNELISDLSEREINDKLNSYILKGITQHEEIQLGFIYSILTDAVSANLSYQNMTLLNRDGFTVVLSHLNQIIFEKWPKLLDPCKNQMVWLFGELVKNGVNGVDSVCHSLMRQIGGGDISSSNIRLTENLLQIFIENRSWLDNVGSLIPSIVYTFLRVAVDHNAPILTHLREREIEFCISLLRDKWNDCMTIGRDLIRLLQNVARMPEVEKLWADIMLSPTSLSPTFTGILQLLQTRTSRKYLISRLTPDMENKIVFLTTKVKFGQQKRYQDWFQRQYLSTPESQSLRCDLIRYICAVFHPSNELLCSDIIPRWAVIGWLLTTCTSNVAASNAKLSLFYDWLFFDAERDSIMNIEPAILVMYYSIRPHPAITATLLDFMCRIMSNFCPTLKSQVQQGIYSSLRCILEKRVLQNLSTLFDNPKLDKDLRAMMAEKFSAFTYPEGSKDENVNNIKSVPEEETNNHVIDSSSILDASFSDEEDDSPLRHQFRTSLSAILPYEPIDISEPLSRLPASLRSLVEQLQNEKDQANQCEIMDTIVQSVMREERGYEDDISTLLATCLCHVLYSHFTSKLFPSDVDDESLEDSIGSPLFVMFRNLAGIDEEDPQRLSLLTLLADMYSKQPALGYHLLYFLKVTKGNDDRMKTYKDFCNSLDGKDLLTCLMADLHLCQSHDIRLFTFLLPDLFTQFASLSVGNCELLSLIVSSIDGMQLQDIICQILQGHLVMFKKDSFLSILNASLEWETLEQYFLWQLIISHNIPIDLILPILPKLDFNAHAEALTSIMVLLKQECPTTELIRPILSRSCRKNDLFTVSILKYWAQEFEDRLAELIHSLLTKFNTTPKKRQRSLVKKDGPTVDQILSHLDHIRQVCRNASFLNHEQIQQALVQVQTSASDSQKSKYSDLLALAEDIDDIKTTRVLRGRKAAAPTTRPNQSKPSAEEDSLDSSSNSSEEEEIRQPRLKRKRRTLETEFDSD